MQRLIRFWLDQTYPNRELIIWNTSPVPLSLSKELAAMGKVRPDEKGFIPRPVIRLYNCKIDKVTGQPYTNVGAVRRDAVAMALGDIFCLFDDDDYFFPYHIEQGVRGLERFGKKAWKPVQSLYSGDGGQTFSAMSNTLEASVFAEMDEIKKRGFRLESGSECLAWFNSLKDEGQMHIDVSSPPSYGYEWGSLIAPHKQSGDMQNPNNFSNHKAGSTDFGSGPLTGEYDLEPLYARIRTQFPSLPL